MGSSESSSNHVSSDPPSTPNLANVPAPNNPNQDTGVTQSTSNIVSGITPSDPVYSREAPIMPNWDITITPLTSNVKTTNEDRGLTPSSELVIPKEEGNEEAVVVAAVGKVKKTKQPTRTSLRNNL